MRTFIAIELPAEIKHKLTEIQARLATSRADVKWVAPENIHLTLKFLGEIDEGITAKLADQLARAVKSRKSFSMAIEGIGAFPKADFPKVVWVGVTKGNQELSGLAELIEEATIKIGLPPADKPFTSHITLGRMRTGINRHRLAEKIKEPSSSFPPGNLEFSVAKLTLFKSVLTPSGPLYEKLSEASLATA